MLYIYIDIYPWTHEFTYIYSHAPACPNFYVIYIVSYNNNILQLYFFTYILSVCPACAGHGAAADVQDPHGGGRRDAGDFLQLLHGVQRGV